jgi:hypothetical protein
LQENFLAILESSKLSMEKTIHARMGFAYKVYKSAVLDQSGERENLSIFRGNLLSISGAQPKKKVNTTTKS